MDWKKLDDKIVNSEGYKFFQKHKQLMILIEGIIVIGLLLGIVVFIIEDHQIKTQIKERCGYTTDTWECVCEKNFVENWKKLEQQNFSFLENVTITNEGLDD